MENDQAKPNTPDPTDESVTSPLSEAQLDDLAKKLDDVLNATEAAADEAPAAEDASLPNFACNDRTDADVASEAAPAAVDMEELRAQVAAVVRLEDRESTLFGEVIFQADLPLVGLKARLIYQKLSNFGELRYFVPTPEHLEECEELDKVVFGVVTEHSLADLRAALHVAGVERAVVEQLATEHIDAAAAAKQEMPEEHGAAEVEMAAAAGKQGRLKPSETVRVDVSRLDQLMNLAGQLAIQKAGIAQTADILRESVSDRGAATTLRNIAALLKKTAQNATGRTGMYAKAENAAAEIDALQRMAQRILKDLDGVQKEFQAVARAETNLKNLLDGVHHLDRVSNDIQRAAMDTRMAPIGPLFSRFKRVIRDLTRNNKKDVRLALNGEQTELDKRMIDELGDPLVQLVRNAVEHGIEMPDARRAAGKPAQGTVTLDAFRRGNSVIIQIIDDGQGFDPATVRAQAVQQGLVTANAAEGMSSHDLLGLVWESGFSLAGQAKKDTKCGAGMDAVKDKIADLSGTVDLESTPGHGSTLTIKLPLTLAILPSLMVKVNGDVFALPLESVAEIVCVDAKDVLTVHGLPTARVRDRMISLVSLHHLFTWNQQQSATLGNAQEKTLVILDEKGQLLGLCVDEVLGEEDIVIKSIAENYRNIPGVTGASIRGDGRVSLILDPPVMFKMLSRGTAAMINRGENAL